MTVNSPVLAKQRAQEILQKDMNGVYISEAVIELCDLVERLQQEIKQAREQELIHTKGWTKLREILQDKVKQQARIGYHLRSQENDKNVRIMDMLEKGIKK